MLRIMTPKLIHWLGCFHIPINYLLIIQSADKLAHFATLLASKTLNAIIIKDVRLHRSISEVLVYSIYSV